MTSRQVSFLVASLLVIAVAAAFAFSFHPGPRFWSGVSTLAFLAGTAVVTYKYPVSGTIAPTVKEALHCNEVNAQVTAADSDTTFTVVHNWGLAATDPGSLFPVVIITIDSSATTTVQPVFQVSVASTNQVVVNKPTTVGTQGTYNVVILRPVSLER